MYAAALPPRDPFRPAAFSASHPEPAAPVNPTVSGTGSAKIPNLPVSQPGGLVGELPTTMPSGPGPMVPPTTPSEAPAKPVFEATLIGVMVGARSAAVFRVGDSDRIVRVGGEIEPGVRLVSVTARRAVVRFHGETLRIELKDEAPADSAAPATTPARSPRGAGAASTPPTSAPTLPDSGDQIPND